jgi:hypothetical protein
MADTSDKALPDHRAHWLAHDRRHACATCLGDRAGGGAPQRIVASRWGVDDDAGARAGRLPSRRGSTKLAQRRSSPAMWDVGPLAEASPLADAFPIVIRFGSARMEKPRSRNSFTERSSVAPPWMRARRSGSSPKLGRSMSINAALGTRTSPPAPKLTGIAPTARPSTTRSRTPSFIERASPEAGREAAATAGAARDRGGEVPSIRAGAALAGAGAVAAAVVGTTAVDAGDGAVNVTRSSDTTLRVIASMIAGVVVAHTSIDGAGGNCSAPAIRRSGALPAPSTFHSKASLTPF